jgi:hypothetical protein
VGWHHLESWATLGFELLLPVGIFIGSRRARLATAAILTGFQIINLASANYGFFCCLALALHVFLLDDADVARIAAWLRARFHIRQRIRATPPPAPRWRRGAGIGVLGLFVVISACDALVSFVGSDAVFAAIMPIRRVYAPWRIINTYHLFGHITRARIEADFQTSDDGASWISHEFRHKAGDPQRRPDWVAPHQPRVDFQLWFYGLSYRSGTPEYVATLVERLCKDADAVQSLFRTPMSAHPRAARIVYWQYHFTSAGERRTTGAWWKRDAIDMSDVVSCDTAFPPQTGLGEDD